MRPGELLSGLPPQFEVRTEAEKWQGAFKQAQGAIREQGQVMSAALDNNRSLWETNKRLRRDIALITETSQRLERERNAAQSALSAIPADVRERAALMADNEDLQKAVAEMKQLVARSLYPELDSEGLRAELERVRKQAAELNATGLVPTAEELARQDHARDAQAAEFKAG